MCKKREKGQTKKIPSPQAEFGMLYTISKQQVNFS